MNLKYILGAMVSLPLLPLMYYQGKKIRQSVPKLPEASGNIGKVVNQSTPLKIITIGESTIAGVGVKTHEEGFSGTLAKELSAQIKRSIDWGVYAKSGFTAKMVTERIIPNIHENDTDLIIIGLGGNDAFTLNTPTRWKRDICKLIESLRKKFEHTPIVFTNMPPIKEFPAFTPLIRFTLGNLVEILGEELQNVVSKFPNVYYYSRIITIDDWIHRLGIDEPAEKFFSDGVHPSKLTYQTWAKDTCRYIVDHNLLIHYE